MIAKHTPCRFSLAALTVALFALAAAAAAQAAPEPTKFLLTSHIGYKVNVTTEGDICTVVSGDTCKPGEETSESGGFFFPQGVAVSAETGDVYVADTANHRVQELTAEGKFVSMFGWEVNRTEVEAHAPQAQQNVCTAASKDVCQAGVPGGNAGEFGEYAKSIAVDPTGGGVYIAEGMPGVSGTQSARIQKFTAAGKWVFEIGEEVNATTKGNLCSSEEEEKSSVKCTGAAAEPSTGPGAFNFELESGDLLAVGGPEDLLYVGDQGRVQKFKASGQPAGEVSLTAFPSTSKATGVAVNPVGQLFVVEEQAGGIHIYSAKGELQPTVIDPAGSVRELAIDTLGRPVVIEGTHGVLYSGSGVKISEFAPPSGEMRAPYALAVGPSGELYVVDVSGQEVEAYSPAVFPLANTCPASAVAARSASLCGEVDPNEMPTVGLFDYGTSQGELTVRTPTLFSGEGDAFTPIEAPLTGLEPNQTYYYRAVAKGTFNSETRVAEGEELSFQTAVVAPQILGESSASFITSTTAVLNGSLNPEHAPTAYHFEYAPCATLSCAQVSATPSGESPRYGQIGFAREVQGLLPATTYSFRLVVENEAHQQVAGPEQSFTTAPAPAVAATTGPAAAVSATGAVIAGMVNPDGEPATYAFELGVYGGTATQYGIVLSASAGASGIPIEETLALTGLQPGTTYAYRIAIASGHSHATGATVLFTTQGLPSLLAAPAVTPLLAVPSIAFPKAPTATTTKKLTRAQKLAGALRVCEKKPRRQRAACRRQARKRYRKAK